MEPLGLIGGVVTLVLLVGLGIYAYPMLLKRRHGRAAVAAISVGLFVLFFLFDRGAEAPAPWVSAAFALLWTAAPLIAALIVRRVDPKTRY